MTVSDISTFKHKALHWAGKFDVCCLLDSNDFSDKYSRFDFLIAAGMSKSLSVQSGSAFEALKAFRDEHRQWMFGLLSYDLKNEVENLSSHKADYLQFPELFFFVPEYLILVNGTEAQVLLGNHNIIEEILQTVLPSANEDSQITVANRINKKTYLADVKKIQKHITRGDIYELNYCQEFYAADTTISPVAIYQKLIGISPSPFAAFFRMNDHYILSASPERFLCKKGQQIISQPIKGTARRSTDPVEDEQRRGNLKASKKDQAENVMIVDLVRNDLTKIAVPGTVQVDELFGIYTFPQVHQMISTISCRLQQDIHPVDAIKNLFPMGSMTGAPKIKAMQLIEAFEHCKRGAYSGAVGYIDPNGDFDFNVIIRSILYDSARAYLSFQVGGAITYASDAEQEYGECMLKASGILKTLQT